MGVVAESMKPPCRIAQEELQRWIMESNVERTVMEDAARPGVILRAQLLRFMRSDGNDPHTATSATTPHRTASRGTRHDRVRYRCGRARVEDPGE